VWLSPQRALHKRFGKNNGQSQDFGKNTFYIYPTTIADIKFFKVSDPIISFKETVISKNLKNRKEAKGTSS
jgi:hypothetical protein